MIKHFDEFKKAINEVKGICQDVFDELGPGFDEDDYQMAMSLEFAKSKKLEAMREISVELFYKDQYLKFGELDFLIAPNDKSDYPLPFFIETKVADSEQTSSYDQIRRYLMSLPKNDSSLINKIQIAALIVFRKGSHVTPGEIIEKEGRKTILQAPSDIKMPKYKFYINCYYYDEKEKVIKLIDNLF